MVLVIATCFPQYSPYQDHHFYFPATTVSTPPSTARISPLTYYVNGQRGTIVQRQKTPHLILAQEQNSLSHFLVRTWPFDRDMTLLLHLLLRHFALLVRSGLLGRHLAWEIAWSDAVDSNAGFEELGAHEFGQLNCGTFRSIVAKVTLSMAHDAAHGRDGGDRSCHVAV